MEFENLPEGWVYESIGNYFDIQSGYAFKSSDFIDKGIPVIKIKNITPPTVSLEDIQYVGKDVLGNKTQFNVNYKDILISMTGSNVHQMSSAVGKVSRLQEKNKLFLLNQRVGKFVLTKPEQMDYDFLYYLVSTYDTQYELASNASGSANQANINPSMIKSLKRLLPPLPQQQKIASILGALDDKIELNNQMNQTLETMAKALFKSWFVDFEPFADGEFEESELGMIPKGWKIIPLEELLIDTKSGDWGKDNQQDKYNSEAYCIRGADINSLRNGQLVDLQLRYLKDSTFTKKLLDTRNIIIEISGGSPTQSTGRPLFVNEKLLTVYDKPITSTNFCRILMTKPLVSELLYLKWVMMYDDKLFFNYENGTTGIKNLDLKAILSNEKIALPNDDVISEFQQIVSNFFAKIIQNGIESRSLISIRDALLPKLMSGEISLEEI